MTLAVPATARPWLSRLPGECAFPFGERAAVFSCCAPTEETYCPAHRAVMGGQRKAWVSTDHLRVARAA